MASQARSGSGQEGERGFVYLCDGVAGGPQGYPLTNLFFPLAIDSALKATDFLLLLLGCFHHHSQSAE